jgi:hypothetical protein
MLTNPTFAVTYEPAARTVDKAVLQALEFAREGLNRRHQNSTFVATRKMATQHKIALAYSGESPRQRHLL